MAYKNLPPIMAKVVDEIKNTNPEFTNVLYDIVDCREFIKTYFDNALPAFDKLKPISYKSDLWRLCVLYKYGGVYLDVKFNSFRTESLKFRQICLNLSSYYELL